MSGYGDAFARFDAELDAAVSRARQVSAEARADGAAFREETRKLAESVRNRSLTARPDELTSQQLREQATKFREERGLPVEELPSADELVRAGMVRADREVDPPADEDDDFSQEKILSASAHRDEPQDQQSPDAQPPTEAPPTPPAPQPTPPRRPRRPVPRTSDDDEDFSQERILSDG